MSRVVVPAREGRSVEVEAGNLVRVVTEEGGQVGDVFAFVAGGVDEPLSAAHTRAHLSRLFPLIGEQFVTSHNLETVVMDCIGWL